MKSWLFISIFLIGSSWALGEVNYDDPNLAMTNNFVSEAATYCTRRTNDQLALERCIENYQKDSKPAKDTTRKEIAPKDIVTKKEAVN